MTANNNKKNKIIILFQNGLELTFANCEFLTKIVKYADKNKLKMVSNSIVLLKMQEEAKNYGINLDVKINFYDDFNRAIEYFAGIYPSKGDDIFIFTDKNIKDEFSTKYPNLRYQHLITGTKNNTLGTFYKYIAI